ncbi:hypothetical protein F511_08683 [Dorcoceras hygrometricum]|uniref:Dystroglycan-like n=1 Tax=Dorcoceras hygrometricum TaxID=472368 RepID=A0A2Z7CGT9_9LAMI|nr:hypothetical protein F511_08683 [Dorcoceras hygrometricum]
MNFVKASVIHNTYESVKYDDQISGKLNQKGKAGIGYVRLENSKSGWLKNRLDKEKAKLDPRRLFRTNKDVVLRRGNIAEFRFGKISDLEVLSFRGNERSELISAESTEYCFYLSGVLLFDTLSEMASSFITNALQVNFESFLGISDNEGMVQMFRALEATGLRGFLGCPSVLYEQELEQFFDTALVQDGDITCVVSGKYVAISETRFAGVFNLPTDGLTDLSKVPNDLVLQARTLFSKSSVPVQFSCKKRLMKYEFRLLNDIWAKSITVKAGSFDAVTHERFLMMIAIHFGIKVNWRKLFLRFWRRWLTGPPKEPRVLQLKSVFF